MKERDTFYAAIGEDKSQKKNRGIELLFDKAWPETLAKHCSLLSRGYYQSYREQNGQILHPIT